MAAETTEPESASTKETTVACTLDFNGIITALHEKALSQLGSTEYTVQNSAIEGVGKDAKFYGAGSHIIAAIPKENKGLDKNKIPKKVALELLQKYTQWFVGPDLKKAIAETDLIPLEDEDSGKTEDTHLKKDDIKRSRGATGDKAATASKEKYKESFQSIPSFSEYLILEAGEDASPEGSSEASGETGTSSDGSSSSSSESSSGSSDSSSDEESASGYYIAYQLEMKPGEKGHPISDALKKMGADLLKGFGIRVGSWRSGASGDVKTLGDIANAWEDIFGKIDSKELESKVQENMAKKFKDGDFQVKVIDSKTIIAHLGKQLAGSEKAKVKQADVSLCTKVNKKDKSYKLYNKQSIADVITDSISGIVKKVKNRIKKEDIILVNNYSDNKKVKGEVKYTEKGEGSVEDSLVSAFPGRIITEALSVEDRRRSIKQKLEELAKKNLGEAYKKSDALLSKDLIELLKKNGIDEPKLFSQLEDSQNSFYICTASEAEEPKESMQSASSMLKMLFEADEKDIESSVKKSFTDMLFSFKDYLPKGKEISEKAISNVQELIAKDPVESLKSKYNLISQVFEDMSFDDFGYILEAGSNTAAHINEIIDRAGAENIIANKDKIIAAAKETYKGTSEEDKAIKKALIGQKAKDKEVKWNKKRAAGWNKKHPDDKREAGYVEKVKQGEDVPGVFDEFFKLTDAESMKAFVNKEFGDVSKDEDKERVVQGFWKCLDLAKLPDKGEEKEEPKKPEPPEPLPEEVKELQIGFLDRDPETKQLDDPQYVTVKVGGSLTPPEPKYETEKHKFNGWRDSNGVLGDFDDVKEPKSYTAEYAHEVELDKFIVTFQDFNPETGEISEIEFQEVPKGGAAKEPKLPEHEGWKFKEWTQPFDNVTASIETMTLWDPAIKIVPKAPKDPAKPREDLEPIGDPIEYDPEKPIAEQLPKLPEKDGWETDGWDPDPETIKDPKENIEIIGKYKKPGDSGEPKKQKVSYWVIPDENGLLDEVKIKFDIKLVNPDPEDPDNTGSWKDVAVVHVIDGKYTVDDLKKLAKAAKADEADEIEKAAEENEKAFREVENIMKMDNENKPYKFLGWTTDENGDKPTFEKKEIQEVIDELIRSGKAPEDDEVTMRAVWSNDIKAVHTELDFYIVPMKGLGTKKHFNNDTGRTED